MADKESSKVRLLLSKLGPEECSALQDIVEFGNVVNAQCERAEMALSIEELKILIFI